MYATPLWTHQLDPDDHGSFLNSPAMAKIQQSCSSCKFRVLIAGRTNSGKSTLLAKMSLDQETHATSHGDSNEPDVSLLIQPAASSRNDDIENEVCFQSFDIGSMEKIVSIQQFIIRRVSKAHIKERLHAIWYCIPIDEPPNWLDIAFLGQIERRGMYEELRGRRGDTVTPPPIIALFTKSDRFMGANTFDILKKYLPSEITGDHPFFEFLSPIFAAKELARGVSLLTNQLFLQCLPHSAKGLGQLIFQTVDDIIYTYGPMLGTLSQKALYRNNPSNRAPAAWNPGRFRVKWDKFFRMRKEQASTVKDNETTSMPRGAVDLTKYLTKVGTSPMAEGGFSDIWQGRLDARAPIPTSMYRTGNPFERTSAFSAAPLKVAIKQLRGVRIKDDDKSKRLFIRMKRELNIWAQLRDNCFVPLLGYSFYGTMPCLISPWYEFGNVLQYMQQRPDANKPDLILDVIEGLYYLHHLNWPPITHGDIKAANVLVDQDGNARISDFGLSKVLQDGSSGYTTSSATAGTSRWMAPELFQEHGERCQETDIYALSLTVVEIYTNGTPPFPHLNDIKFLGYISTSNTPHRSHYPDLQLSEPIWKVLEAGWQLDAQKRPTAHDFQEGYLIGLWS